MDAVFAAIGFVCLIVAGFLVSPVVGLVVMGAVFLIVARILWAASESTGDNVDTSEDRG